MKSCPCYIREAKSQVFWIAKLSTWGLDSFPIFLYGRTRLGGCNAQILFYFWLDMSLWFIGLNYSCNHGIIKSHSPCPHCVQVTGDQRIFSMTLYAISYDKQYFPVCAKTLCISIFSMITIAYPYACYMHGETIGRKLIPLTYQQ